MHKTKLQWIYHALYPDNINAVKRIKNHTSKNCHNCSCKKTITGKGQHYIDRNTKTNYASLQICFSPVRSIVDGKLVAIDVSTAHLEMIKNLAYMLEVPKDKYDSLQHCCDSRNQVLNDMMGKFDCVSEVAKNSFVIT